MPTDDRRFTLITSGSEAPPRNWNDDASAPERIIVIKSFAVLSYLLSNGPDAATHDVARIIIDHAASPIEFLEMLASLPHEVTADVLLINGPVAFLSAMGRGGDRVMYRLSAEDVDFYLLMHRVKKDEEETGFYIAPNPFAAAELTN